MYILEWFNLLFVLPFALALLYLFLYAATGLTFGEADADADVDGDVDADVDADADADLDADADGDVESIHALEGGVHADAHGDVHSGAHDGGHDGHASGGTSILIAALSIFGIGRVPLSLGLMIFCFTWGVLGVIMTHAMRAIMPAEWMTLFVALPVAFVGGAAVTNIVARLVARFMPTVETYARKRAALVGRRGEAISIIDAKFGTVAVRDERGELYQVPARVGQNKPVISKGQRVVLFDYLGDEQIYLVAPFREQIEKKSETTPPLPPEPKRIAESGESASESQETYGGTGQNAAAN